MYKHARLTILALTVIFISFQSFTSYALAATRMPSFALENVVTGETVDSAEFTGKSLLIIFFATWCPPCIEEIPTLIDMQNKYRGQQFSVVGLSVDQEGKQVVQKLVEKKNINYPVLMADNTVTRNFGGVYGIPTSFLVNSKGNVVKKYTGYVPRSVLIKDIEQIIQ